MTDIILQLSPQLTPVVSLLFLFVSFSPSLSLKLSLVGSTQKPSTKKATKAKVTAQKKTIPSRAASAELESSSLSDPDHDDFNLNADDASTADDEPDDEELFDVTGMSEKEARKLLDNEVTVFYVLILFLRLQYNCSGTP